MKGPVPKPAATRQRRNKQTTAATLPSEQESKSYVVPDLPAREQGWHPMVKEWWTSVWQSPMASEFLDADMRGGLFHLAKLHQAAWSADDEGDVRALLAASAEIRLQEVRFGLSPIDRRRLQWEVSRAEEAVEKTNRRRDSGTRKAVKDPRRILKLG